ncbi:MAG: ATP-binding protein [Gammaproteobacteria bacterium]|nr:ATP-binding protein [Gammaproteobacteria bacterium]
MIVASLLAIGAVALVVFSEQSQQRLTQVRSHGVGLARVLGGMAWQELVPGQGRQGILQTLQHSQNNPDFAYAAVVDQSGAPANVVAAAGIVVPDRPLPNDPSAWLGEREVVGKHRDLTFLEFHAPVFRGGDLAGYVRLGYIKPGFVLDAAGLSSIATVGLPVFLLMPLFYFLLRNETRPLRKISDNLDEVLATAGAAPVELHPSGELSDFIKRFSGFIDAAQNRIHALQAEHDRMLTSTKLLAYKQSKVESILQMLPEAILVLDEAGIVAYANQRVAGMLGVDRADVIGKRPRDWCKNPNLLAYLSRRHSGQDQVGFISDSVQIVPDYDPDKVLEAKIYPLFAPRDEDSLLGDLVVVRDITEQHVAKRSRSEFVAQIAHELKTPLNVLAMYSESLLGDDGKDESFRVEALNVIHDEVERLAGFLNSMLAISQFELGSLKMTRTRVRVPELLTDAFNTVAQSGRGRDLSFDIDVPREMSALHVDKDLLRIAINNLLTNAIKYNRPGGRVTLVAEESEDAVLIRVSDTGLGISDVDQQKIFDKFYRSDDDQVREQNGHGLGLPLAQQIIQLHHGSLELESTLGEGSTFTITLYKEVPGFAMAGNG